MLDCIKNLKPHPPRGASKGKTPWGLFVSGKFKSRNDGIVGYIGERITRRLIKNQSKGDGGNMTKEC